MKIFNIFKGLSCALLILLSPSAFADWATVENDISITKSRSTLDRVNRVYVSIVTIENTGTETIRGPFRVMIENATLVMANQTGTTPEGVPYIDLVLEELAPGQSKQEWINFSLERKRLSFDASLQNNAPGWSMVWNDEFDGETIDLSKWEHEINCTGGGNNEKQCYTDNAENSYIEDGILKIAALPETGNPLPYSSARLRTLDKGDWKYGRFEIRAKSASGQGSLPAIWMLPSDYVYGGWPNSGEIDIFEGNNVGVPLEGGGVYSDVHGTLHYGQDWPNNAHTGLNYTLPNGANPADDFHIYTTEWEEGEIRWYVDGVLYQTQRKSEVILDDDGDAVGLSHRGWFTDTDNDGLVWNNAPYDQRFHLLINFAVGGNWPENTNLGGVDASAYHAGNTFEVDYVRVYQCEVDPATGKGCATVNDGYLHPVNEGGTLVNGAAPTPIKPSTGIATDLNVFINALNDHWPAWDCCAGSIATIETDDIDHDQVVEFTIGANPTVVGFNTTLAELPTPYDGSPMLDTGVLAFDLKLVTAPNNASATWNVKVEQAGATSEAAVTIATPTTQWQHYEIPLKTLRNAGLGLNGIDAILIFPSWGQGEGAVFRVDNVTILEGDVPPPANATSISVNFENSGDSYAFENFDGGVSLVVANPDTSGINSSTQVVQMQKYAGQPWGGSVLSLNNAIDIAEGTTVTMKVWSERPVPVLFKLEGMNVERSVEHTGTGWEELTFDFSGDTGVNVNAVTLIFDLGTLGDADTDAQNWTFYYDDIVLSSSGDDNIPPAEDEFVLISSSQASDIDFGANTVGEWSTGSNIVSDVTYQQRLAWEISSSANTAAQGNWGTVLAFQDGIIGDFSTFTSIALKLATTGGYSEYKLYISANGVSHEITLPINDNDSAWQNVIINTVDIPLSLSSIDSVVVFATGGLPGISKVYLTDFSLLQNDDAIFNDATENDFVFISSDNSVASDLIVDNDDNSAAGNVIFGEWSTGTALSNTNYAGLNAMQLTAGGSWGAVLALQGDISDGVNIDNFDVDLANYTNIKFKMASQGAFAKYGLTIVSKVGDNEVSQEVEFSLANPSDWNNIDIDLDMFGVNLSNVSQIALFGAYDGGSATQQIFITDLIAYDSGRTVAKTSSDDKFVFFSSSGEQSDMVFDGNDLTNDGNITIGEWSTGTSISQDVIYQGLSSVELTKGSWGAVLALMGDVYGGVQQYSFDVAQYQNINFKIATTGSFSEYIIAFISNGAEFKVPLTVTSDWTEVSINVAEVPVDLSKLTQMVIYAAGGAAGDKFYVTDLNIATDGNTASTNNNTDFESAPSYVFTDFDGGITSIIANPQSTGINASANVVQMQKFANQTWGGTTYDLAGSVDIGDNTVITMKVWSTREVPVLFKLEGLNIERTVMHTGTGWEELSFDFSGDTGAGVTAVTIIFDNGVMGDAATDATNWTFYFDDINLPLFNSASNSDSDNDGITDDIDQCLDTPADTAVDDSGCAVVITPPTTDSELVIFADGVNVNWPAWDCCAGSVPTEETDDVEHGLVNEFSIGATATVMGYLAADGAEYDATPIFDNGVLEFDFKVVSAPLDTASVWKLKLESNTSTYVEIDLTASNEGNAPVVGEWVHFSYNISELSTLGLDTSAINIVMVFPAWGTGEGAVYRLDNVRIGEPAPSAEFTIFDEEINANWVAWDCCAGSIPGAVIDDAEHNVVVEFAINGDTVVGFSTRADHGSVNGVAYDASVISTGTFEFDLKMTASPGETDWKLKLESNNAATFAEVNLSTSIEAHAAPVLNTWQHYSFNLADLAAAGLDISAIDIAMVFPAWGTGTGAVFRIDNVNFYAGDDVIVQPPVDSDGDGVNDDIDQCADTPAETAVDALGCTLTSITGIEQTSSASVTFFVNTSGWADLHFSINGGPQQNLRMENSGSRNTYLVEGISANDVITYSFTYLQDSGGATDSVTSTHTVIAGTDSDGDGIYDDIDQCPNTPANSTVDANGCIVVAATDTDGDGVYDDIDQCPNTPEYSTVDAVGCIIVANLDSDNDGVNDDIDQCPNTTENTEVDAVGCPLVASEGRIEVENYTAFLDNSVGDNGGAGNGDDVDIENTTDIGGGRNVGWTSVGEWLEYQVTLSTGLYTVNARVASQASSGKFEILVNGQSVGSNSVGNTGGWQTFVTQQFGLINIEADDTYTVRLNVTGSDFNINWFEFVATFDTDGDGVLDAEDQCPETLEGALVNSFGCEIITVNTEVSYANERLVGGASSAAPGFTLYVFDNDLASPDSSVCIGGCVTNWPPVLVEDLEASGVNGLSTIERADGTMQAAHNGRPLYFFAGDSATGDTNGEGVGDVWWLVPYGVLGDVTSLYNATTVLEADTQVETEDALITRFSDRPRTRHAKEDQFQSYDHYIKFYFEDRSSNIEIIDYVAKGGDTIVMNVRTIFPLSDLEAENRWWYQGFNTVAQFASNGIMDFMGTEVIDGVTYYNYQKTGNENTRLGREIRIGDEMEFEISQFSAPGIPRGQTNYYGTTFLYIVGEGIVPWYTEISGPFPEDSAKIPEEYWLGGNTSMHYQYTDEPDNHFMQMATNLGYDNGQSFLLGRRVHHSSFVDGTHDENPDNGVFEDNVGLSGARYVNESCVDCHARNGSAPVAENGELLDRWVFKVGDADGNPDPTIGRVLQPNGSGGEGEVSISSWTELSNGLRIPNYHFSGTDPATFSARIAPRLIGLGLLEAISEVDIIALADPTDADGNGISGVANKTIDPENSELTRLGRFGWKAATSSVRHQVAGALNTDIGVRTSVLPDLDCGSEQTNCGGASPLMPEENLNNLVKYISTLGVRPQRVWKSGVEDTQVIAGSAKFEEIGCVGCHTKTFQTSEFHPLAEVRNQTIHPYSDMLLHDMGPGLADNLGEGLATGSEWRTTPLWGLGLSACVTGGVTNPTGAEGDEICTPHHAYLHDGRARSIEEAILWHGGESETSKVAYEALTASDKATVLAFLNSL